MAPMSRKRISHDRKLGRILIKLADDDSWKACLYILLDRDKKLKDNQRLSSRNSHDHIVECQEQKKESYHKLAWLSAVTDHGDSLIHLAAFAACEVTMPLEERRFALECLNEIIKADFSCVNRIAGDGGSPLHSALAAASSSLVDGQDDNFDSDHESESDTSKDESSDDEESECTVELTKNEIAELESHISVEDCEFSSYSSEELVLKTIYLLLENSTDPNLPLANIHQISDYNEQQQEEQDEVELAYSREAVIEQWTPLTFSILWLSLAASSSHNNHPKQALTHDSLIALPLLVLNLLLQYGANPSYLMGGNNVHWTGFEFFISCSYHLKQATLTAHVISRLRELLTKTEINLDPFLFLTDLTAYTMTWKLLESTTDKNKIQDNIKPIQAFTVAVMSDDKRMAESILIKHNIQQELLNTWCHTPIGNIIPTSKTLWSFQSGSHSTTKIHCMTVLEIMAYCLAIESVDFVLSQRSLQTDWTQLKRATRALFMNLTLMITCDDSLSTIQDSLYLQQRAILTTFMNSLDHYLDTSHHSKPKKGSQDHVFVQSRQSFLDVLLLESCCRNWGLPHALPIFLEFGADPKVSSISNSIENTLLPLHFVCSNIRGHDGITIVEYLLMSGNVGTFGKPSSSIASNASINYSYLYERATFEGKHCRPIDISLEKRNFRLSEYLWELEQQSLKNCKMVENAKDMWCSIDQCYTLCEASIERKNIQMFQFAVDNMTKVGKDLIRRTNNQSDNLAKKFGKLLLWVVDERSGFGRIGENEKLMCAVELINQVRTEMQLWKIPAFARDEISGNSPLHLLLRQDRGISLRKRLLPCLCKMMEEYDHSQIINSNGTHRDDQAVKEETDKSDDDYSSRNNLVSLPCSPKFGGYTALHLAVSLGCVYSIQILLQFKAFVEARDSGGKQPVDHTKTLEKELANKISQLLLSVQ